MIRYLSILLFCSGANAQSQYNIYFDFDIDKANVRSGVALKNWIDENKNAEITKVYGYADTAGNAMYNTDLSERRAGFVSEQLKNGKIKFSGTTEIKGFGEASTAATMAGNRLVTIYFNALKDTGIQLAKAVNKAKKGDKLKLAGLNFYNNSDRVLPQSQPVLEELLLILEKDTKLKIEIQGHICCQPVELEKISYYRAKAIYDFLIKNGINENRLSYKSFGSSRPIYALPEKDETQRKANRRVEIEIIEN